MSSKEQINMCEGPILKNMLRMVLPSLVSSFIGMGFSVADKVVIGRFASSDALAAIGSTGGLVGILSNLASGLSLGATIIVSRAYGAKDKETIERATHTSMAFASVVGLITAILGVILSRSMLSANHVPPQIFDRALFYLRIHFLCLIPSMFYQFSCAILRAFGNTKRPMYIGIFSGLTNVVLNLILVIVFKLSVVGVGIATLIANTISAVLGAKLLFKTDADYKINVKKIRFYKKETLAIMVVGIPSGVQTTLHSLANVTIQGGVNSLGESFIAGVSVSHDYEMVVWGFCNAMNTAITTFVSQNFGARNFKRIKEGIRKGLLTTFFIGLTVSTLINVFSRPLLRIFTEDAEVIKAGMLRLKYVGQIYFTCGISDVIVGILRGKNHTIIPTVVSLVCICGIRIVWVYTVFAHYKTPESLFMAYVFSWISAITINSIFLKAKEKKDEMSA